MSIGEIILISIASYLIIGLIVVIFVDSLKNGGKPGNNGFSFKTSLGIYLIWPIFVLRYVLPLFVTVPVFIGQSIAAGIKELP